MERSKNPLRQLASDIVTACRKDNAKGVKHSTVLTVLTKQRGFRSHQASDAAIFSKKITPLMVFVQGVIYQSYPSGDLLPVLFNDIAGREISAQECGDSLFAWLFNSALLIRANKLPEYIFASYEQELDYFSALHSYNAVKALPVGECVLRDFFRTELLEYTEGIEGGDAFKMGIAEAFNRVEHELREVAQALEAIPEWFLTEAQ